MLSVVATTERITIHLPEGFEASRHLAALARKVAEAHGDGWEIDSIDPGRNVAYATRQVAVTELSDGGVSSGGAATIEMRLARGTKPGDGEKVAARFADAHPGYQMVSYEPWLGRATLARMDPETARARDAVAVALGAKPWEVAITRRADGGFDLGLPRTYVPSRHDEKLSEVATAVVGRDGWYVETDPGALVASIIPGDPPSFPPVVAYPFDATPAGDWARVPIGVRLGRTGGELGKALEVDFVTTPHLLTSGLTGSGKGFLALSLISGALVRGWEYILVDAVKGGVDYVDIAPFVRPGGWGEDLRSACCVLSMAYAEGVRRKQAVKAAGVQKWTQLPSSAGLHPLLVVVDEMTSLLAAEPAPKGVAKDNPLVLEIAERNLLKATILATMGKIARELRFVGVSLACVTQVASSTVGIPTELRANLGTKILLGSKPTDNNRRLALNDPDAVPRVPGNIAADPAGASRGVGVSEMEGQEPCVFKGYFAEPADYAAWLYRLGVPTTDRPAPTAAEIARYTPSLDDDAGPGAPSSPPDDWERDPETGERLSGFARANAARHAATEGARRADHESSPPS